MSGAAGVQVATGTFVVTIGAGQVIVTQLLPALPVCGVQVRTGTDVPTTTLHSVVTQPLARVGPEGTQVPDGMVAPRIAQIVVCQPLPALPAAGVQVCTAVAGLTIVGAGQVVVVQLLPALGDEAVQVETETLVVLFEPQVVVV